MLSLCDVEDAGGDGITLFQHGLVPLGLADRNGNSSLSRITQVVP